MTAKVKSKFTIEAATVLIIAVIVAFTLSGALFFDDSNTKIMNKLNSVQADVWRYQYKSSDNDYGYRTVSPSECSWYDLSGSGTTHYVCANTTVSGTSVAAMQCHWYDTGLPTSRYVCGADSAAMSGSSITVTTKVGTYEHITSLSPYCSYTITNGYVITDKCTYQASTTFTAK